MVKINQLISLDELAKILSVPKSWIYARTRFGNEGIPHIKLGKYIRFDLKEVEDFLNKKHEENNR